MYGLLCVVKVPMPFDGKSRDDCTLGTFMSTYIHGSYILLISRNWLENLIMTGYIYNNNIID